MNRNHPVVLAAVLVLVAGGGLDAWFLWPAPRPDRVAVAAKTDDDVDWVARERTAGHEPRGGDRLVADRSGVYFASQREHAVFRVSRADPAEKTTLAHFEGEEIAAMNVGGGVLCLATERAGEEGNARIAAWPLPQGPAVTVTSASPPIAAIACDRQAVFVAILGDAGTGLLRTSEIRRLALTPSPASREDGTGNRGHRDADGTAHLGRPGADGGANGDPRDADRGANALVLGRSDGSLTSLAIDDDHVFWADSLDERIVAVSKEGGPLHVLAENRGLPRSLVLGGDTLFWVEARSESIWAMAKTGGPVRQVAQDFAGFTHLTVTAGAGLTGPDSTGTGATGGVFWVNETAAAGGFRVLGAPLAGGEVSALSPTVLAVDALAVSGGSIFWVTDGQVAQVGNTPDGGRSTF